MRGTPGVSHLGKSRRFPNGGWEVRYRTPDNSTRRKTFELKQQALDFQAQVRTDKRRGDFVDPKLGNTVFRDVAEGWFATRVASLKPKTRQGYRYTLDRYLLPALGDKRIGRITKGTLSSFLASLPQTLSPTTQLNIYRTLYPILSYACDEDMIRVNPAASQEVKRGLVKRARESRKEMHFLTPAEVEAVAEAVPSRYRTLVYFAAHTGCRSGEIAALRVRNLDMLRAKVTISESLADVSGQLHFGAPKNGKPRTFGIPPWLVDMLADHLASVPNGPDDFVFPGRDRKPIRHGNFYARHFKPAVRGALPPEKHGVRFHDLRHTHAAILIRQGVHPKVIMSRLGHSSIAVTIDRYGHLYDDHEDELLRGLETLRPSAPTPTPSGAVGEVVALR